MLGMRQSDELRDGFRKESKRCGPRTVQRQVKAVTQRAVGLCQIPLGYIYAGAFMNTRQTKVLSIKWKKRSFRRYEEFFVTKSPFGKFPVSCS